MIETIQIGDVFVNATGFEQVNVDFYLVVGKIGKTTLLIREMTIVHGQRAGDVLMSSYVTPGEATGRPMRVKISNQSINLGGGRCATKWDGKPQYCSWFGI